MGGSSVAWTIESATADSLAAVAAAGLTHAAGPMAGRPYHFDPRSLARHLASGDRIALVVCAANRPVGLIAASRDRAGFAWIDDFVVATARRRMGAGRRLMDGAMAWARSRSLAGVRLESQADNTVASGFYRAYGFELGNHDRYLNDALSNTEETTLLWSLRFTSAGRPRQGGSRSLGSLDVAGEAG